MSRIGKNPVAIPDGVSVNIVGPLVTAKGKLGELSAQFTDDVEVTQEDNLVYVKPRNTSREARKMWGTSKSIISNLVVGVSEGFTRKLEINGVGYRAQVQGKTLSEAVDLMRGPVGSEIEITVRRIGTKKALTFNIVRDIIEIKSVKSKVLEDSIGYVRLTSFNDNSSDQLEDIVKDFKKNKNIDKYILDLRNNPGGLLNQAIRITDFFLDNGEIVSTKSKKKSDNRKWFAKKGDLIDGDTLLVLINYGSASASEIVAGALKDHKRAIILGESSYGKGSVQSIIPLKNNGAIRLTVSKYYLPSGDSISEVGVSPDIFVAEGSDEFRIDTDTDNQLEFALKLLNG